MSSSKISTFKKDKNLKLNKADCDKFLKDFQKYTKKEIDHVVNPKTNRKLIDSDKIFFLNDHCQNLIGVSGQEDIIEVQIKEYEDILQLVRNRELIKNLFNQKVKTIDKSIQLFKTYADDNPTDKYIIFYNEINVEIVHLLKNELNISYSFTRNFNILEVNRKDLFSKLQNINIYNEIFSLLTKYIQSIILKSEGYTTAKHVFEYIENNMPKYIAIMFILVVLMDYTKHTGTHFHKQLDILTDIVDYIMLNKFVIKYGNNYSLSKSPDWSVSPLSTSKKLKYRETKKNLLKHILEQCENDYDPFTMEEFEDFSLKKLKQIIIIKTTQKHSYGFYAKTLYQYWQTKHLEKEPFTNPYTRKDFTEKEKDLIVQTMSNIYPDIEGPSSDFIRPDLKMYIFITPENTFIFTMYFKIAEQLIPLIKIKIHHSIVVSDDVPPEYNIVFLREKLRSFFSTNKLISKSIPFKIHPVLQKYDHINTLSDYIDFCSSLI